MSSTQVELGKTDKMTDRQIVENIKALIDRWRVVGYDAIAIDAGTWDRVMKAITVADGFYASMSGDHFLFGKKVLFTKRAGVQLLLKGPAQTLLEL